MLYIVLCTFDKHQLPTLVYFQQYYLHICMCVFFNELNLIIGFLKTRTEPDFHHNDPFTPTYSRYGIVSCRQVNEKCWRLLHFRRMFAEGHPQKWQLFNYYPFSTSVNTVSLVNKSKKLCMGNRAVNHIPEKFWWACGLCSNFKLLSRKQVLMAVDNVNW